MFEVPSSKLFCLDFVIGKTRFKPCCYNSNKEDRGIHLNALNIER